MFRHRMNRLIFCHLNFVVRPDRFVSRLLSRPTKSVGLIEDSAGIPGMRPKRKRTITMAFPVREGGILFPRRRINVRGNTLNRYYLTYLSGLMAGMLFYEWRRASLVIHYPRDISVFTFLSFYSADKRDRLHTRSRYLRAIRFDLICNEILFFSRSAPSSYYSNPTARSASFRSFVKAR